MNTTDVLQLQEVFIQELMNSREWGVWALSTERHTAKQTHTQTSKHSFACKLCQLELTAGGRLKALMQSVQLSCHEMQSSDVTQLVTHTWLSRWLSA